MSPYIRTLAEINREAIRLLFQELGPVDASRFFNQFAEGRGDYTEDRGKIFEKLSLEDILESIDRRRETNGSDS